MSVQDEFFTLEISDPDKGETVYDVTKSVLNKHIEPEINMAYERSIFRAIAQEQTGTVENFITRLRQ